MTNGIIGGYEYGNRMRKREYYVCEYFWYLETTTDKSKATPLTNCEGAKEWLEEKFPDYEWIILPTK